MVIDILNSISLFEVYYFMISMFSIFTVFFYFSNLNDKKLYLNLKNLLMILLVAIVVYILHIRFTIFLKTTLLLVIYFCINKIYFKLSAIKSITHTFLFILILLIFDIVFGSLMMLFIQENNKYFNLIQTTYHLFVYIFLIIIIKSEKVKYLIKKNLNNIEKFLFNNIIIFLEILMYIVISCIMYALNASEVYIGYLIILLILCTIFLVIFQINFLTYKKNIEAREKLYNLNKQYADIISQDSVYKHNIKNKLIGIKAVSPKKVAILINDVIESEEVSINNIAEFSKIPSYLLNVFFDKLYNIQNTYISIQNFSKKSLNDMMSIQKIVTLVEAIGICLDNTLEAIKCCHDNKILIIFKEESNRYVVEINNTFCDHLDLDKLGEKNYTTKEKGSGIGLHSLSELKGIDSHLSIVDNIFKVKLEMKIKVRKNH